MRGTIGVHTGAGLHRPRGPRHRRALQLPGQHDGPRHGPGRHGGGVRGEHGRRCRSACSRRSTRPKPRAATCAAASRRRWSSCPPRASRGGGRSTCESRTTTLPLDELRRLLTLQSAYDLAGAGDELLAAGRTDEAGGALQERPRSSPRTRTSCCSGPASRERRPATSRAAWPPSGGRSRRTRTGWSSSTGSHRTSLRPGRPCVSRSPEGGTSPGSAPVSTLTLSTTLGVGRRRRSPQARRCRPGRP